MRLPVPARRLGFRAAYWGLRLYWFVARPNVSGVKCVLTAGDQVLLVRHTYGARNWELPGGSVRRGEDPRATARREMSEELGISVDDWQAIGELSVNVDHRNDHIHCFQAELADRELAIDLGELAAASWFPRHELPNNLGRYVLPVLSRL